MTILVVFGIPGNFGVAHGYHVDVDGGNKIYFAEDKGYTDACDLGLPPVTENTLLPVLQHKGGSQNHSNQIAWLSGVYHYKPFPVGYFSHKDDLFNTMKRLLTDSAVTSSDDISKFVDSYSKRMVLQLIEKLAAWNTLWKISNDQQYLIEIRITINQVSNFLGISLSRPDITSLTIKDALDKLQAEAAKFC
jgi:hypothetical protein